jgi:NAD(P)-dependent dehydrogenase (short-subunit alcohol dehydrogenase family)
LARTGYVVFALARRRDLLETLASEAISLGGQIQPCAIDVRQADETAHLIREIDERASGLELVVACAGVGVDPKYGPLVWEGVRDALTTNFVGAGATLMAALPAMLERGAGHLVGISSLASYGALPGGVAYSAPKAGLSMMLDCLRLDTHGTGITVTEVKLGFVDTASVENAKHALPQLKKPEEVARVLVKRLASRPKVIVYPRLLGAAARMGAHLPAWSRRLAFRYGGAD